MNVYHVTEVFFIIKLMVNPRMGTTANAVTGTISNPWNYICTIRLQNRTHLKQTTAVVGVIVNLRMVTTVVTSTSQSISVGPVRP